MQGVKMNEVETVNDNWSPCPPETLTVLASVLKRRQRQNKMQRIALLIAAVLIIMTVGRFVANQQPGQEEHSYAGITCRDVNQSLPDYVAGKLDESKRAKIAAHLKLCAYCSEIEHRLRERQNASAEVLLSNEILVTAIERNEQ